MNYDVKLSSPVDVGRHTSTVEAFIWAAAYLTVANAVCTSLRHAEDGF